MQSDLQPGAQHPQGWEDVSESSPQGVGTTPLCSLSLMEGSESDLPQGHKAEDLKEQECELMPTCVTFAATLGTRNARPELQAPVAQTSG